MGPEREGRFGIVFNIKCYHPKEDKEYQCKTIEGNDSEYQGYRCPKCNHEICMTIKQYFFDAKELKEEK
jgi:DNA-directed RNA polymerase subunit RPC12/RpoP